MHVYDSFFAKNVEIYVITAQNFDIFIYLDKLKLKSSQNPNYEEIGISSEILHPRSTHT